MSFINQSNCLICNSIGDVFFFRLTEQGINLSHFDKALGEVLNKTLVKDSIEEYDVSIDKNDVIYLICQKKNGDIVLLTYDNNGWSENIIAERFSSRLFNLNIVTLNDTLHLLYCVQSNEDVNKLKISHHYLNKSNWVTNEVKEISKKDILNPFQIICNGEEMILGYYDILGTSEEVFIMRYNTSSNKWSNAVKLTASHNRKLYIDMIMTNDGCINLSYSESLNENLIIKYEKYKLLEDNFTKICENHLSNLANCTHPTFVYSKEILWCIWTEYENIMSCFSDDNGLSWSLPYLWKEYIYKDFTRYKFTSNDKQINNSYLLNHSFGLLGNEISFIGFENIEKAVEVPLKSKKKERAREQKEILNEIEIFDDEENEKMEKEVAAIRENIQILEAQVKKLERYIKDINQEIGKEDNREIAECLNKIKSIEKRLDDIESFIFRRRRGFPFNPRE